MDLPRRPDYIVLETDSLRCTFNPDQAALFALERLTAGGEVAHSYAHAASHGAPLFRLNWDPLTQEPKANRRPFAAIGAHASIRLISVQPVTVGDRVQSCTAVYDVRQPAPETGEESRAEVRLTLQLAGQHEISFSLVVKNHSTQTISEVIFPVLTGVRAAANVDDEALLYPFYSGAKINAPRQALLAGRREPHQAAPLAPSYAADGTAIVRHLYCGDLSMSWLALDGQDGGLALLHYDPTFEMSALSIVAPMGDELEVGDGSAGQLAVTSPGLDLGVSKVRPIAPGEERRIAPSGVLLYNGSWHQASDRYQAWIRPLLLRPRVPDWVRESHALTAHYDFKWEDGTFTHTFKDIPALYRRTAQEGITHLFMAGWFTGGFDHMYPEFYPDLDLGTVMDFIDGVRTVRAEGGQCTFYINGSLFGRASRFFNTLGTAWAVKGPNGQTVDRTFFGRDFTISCRGTEGYRRHMKDTVRWLIGEVGASGVYIDTFAAMGPHLCFDASHGHPHPAHWNRDSIAAIRQIEDGVRQANPEAFTMIEGCADLYGQWVVGHLIQAWYYMNSYPEMFRYTFPEYVLVDMVYPSKGQSFRPQRISDEARDQLHRTWVNGCILWMYDQEDQRFCNFRSDPELWAYIKQLLALREAGKSHFAYGVFRDTVGLIVDEERLAVKRFVAPVIGSDAHKVHGEMLAVWNRTGQQGRFMVQPELADSWRAQGGAVRLRGVTVEGKPFDAHIEDGEHGLVVTVPEAPASLLFVE